MDGLTIMFSMGIVVLLIVLFFCSDTRKSTSTVKRKAMDTMTLNAIILFGGGSLALLIGYYLTKRHEEK